MQSIDTALKKIEARSLLNKDTGCIEWSGWKNTKGYGQIRVGKDFPVVHRVVYEMKVAKIPKGLNVLHRCDNRKCVNTEHLFLGTNDENIMDKCLKDRSGKKLNIEKVKRIKMLLLSGCPQVDIAREFGVHPVSISRIENGQRWTHVTVGG